MRFGILTILAVAVFLPTGVSAQSLDGLGGTDSFTISVTPQYAAPASPVTLSFLSSSIDLTNATVAVSVGGTQIYRGSVQPTTIMLGRAGSVTSVRVVISSGGTTYSKSVVLQPQDVSLIAEPASSAPVLYPGKPLVPLAGNTRIVAVANMVDASGKTLDPATLSYAWTVDGVQIANSSGIGKEAVIVASPLQYRERAVSVAVQSQAGNLVGGASLSLAPKESSVRVYENDPLLGIRFDHALSGTYTILGAESGLYAAPFSLPLVSGTPLIRWFLNGAAAQIGPVITLRPSGSGQGSAALSLTAGTDPSTVVTTSLQLSFGTKSSTNFFGL